MSASEHHYVLLSQSHVRPGGKQEKLPCVVAHTCRDSSPNSVRSSQCLLRFGRFRCDPAVYGCLLQPQVSRLHRTACLFSPFLHPPSTLRNVGPHFSNPSRPASSSFLEVRVVFVFLRCTSHSFSQPSPRPAQHTKDDFNHGDFNHPSS